jgi:hypothetical protein
VRERGYFEDPDVDGRIILKCFYITIHAMYIYNVTLMCVRAKFVAAEKQ